MRVVQCNIKGDRGRDPKYGPKGNNNDCNCQEKRPKKDPNPHDHPHKTLPQYYPNAQLGRPIRWTRVVPGEL